MDGPAGQDLYLTLLKHAYLVYVIIITFKSY